MTRRLAPVAAALCALTPAACGPDGPPAPEGPPTLVTLVVIDQLRGDLLARYDSLFTGGLRRLLDDGRVFPGSHHAHAVTQTAPGHATLATGTFPSRHGIVANDFWVAGPDSGLVEEYALADTLSPLVGFPGLEGRSPANLERDGLADWVLASHVDARVLSVSKKDRSAIALGGRRSGERVHVYWMNVRARRFATSAFYRDRYPGWVERFNRERMPRLLGDTLWESGASRAARSLARPDSSAFEYDGVHTAFPHRISDAGESETARAAWPEDTPFPDRAVLELVRTGVDSLALGQRGVVDYLGVAFSQTDYIGHEYGPRSQEQLDNLLRLDRILGELMDFLDARIGPGRWILGLSADHGVLDIPEHLAPGTPGALRTGPLAEDSLARRLHEIVSTAASPEALGDSVRSALEAFPWMADVLTPGGWARGETPDSFTALYRASHHPDRRFFPESGAILVPRPRENTLVTDDPTGTSHGSPYWYDRWVPFVVFGPGVRAGVDSVAAVTVDMAPTLAALARIRFPDDLDGVPREARE